MRTLPAICFTLCSACIGAPGAADMAFPGTDSDGDVAVGADTRAGRDAGDLTTLRDVRVPLEDAGLDSQDTPLSILVLVSSGENDPGLVGLLRSLDFDAGQVRWPFFSTRALGDVDVIVVPPGGGTDYQAMADGLKQLDTPVVWMSADTAHNLAVAVRADLSGVFRIQDITVQDHEIIELAGLNTAAPDYEIYALERDSPCFSSVPPNATTIANIANSTSCATFAHVYERGSRLADTAIVPARRVVLPLTAPLAEWTSAAENLLGASVTWAGN